MHNNTTVISPGITVSGRVTGKGSIAIDGRVEGQVLVDGEVSVAAGARCEATIEAERIAVSGAVRGDLKAETAVTLRAGASVEGSVDAKRVEIDPKARVRGALIMPLTLPRGVKLPTTRHISGW